MEAIALIYPKRIFVGFFNPTECIINLSWSLKHYRAIANIVPLIKLFLKFERKRNQIPPYEKSNVEIETFSKKVSMIINAMIINA
jgi:hypothetical protein